MNCIVHNQESAVSTCTNCNVGLCSVCIKEAFKIDNKALCKECTLSFFDSNLQELQQLLESIRTKKIIWTIILVSGIIVGIVSQLNSYTFLPAFFIWALAGFWDRQKRKAEYENSRTMKEAVREGIMERDMYRSNSIFTIMVHMFKLFFYLSVTLIRGIFFPIFYLIFMINGGSEIRKNIEDLKIQKASFEN